MISRALLVIIALTGVLTTLSCGRAETPQHNSHTVWGGLRSAVIYIRVPDAPKSKSTVDVHWQPAWISETQRERLYWYDPKGNLIERVEIGFEQPRGTVSLALNGSSGDYRLVIPGYSFRKYEVSIPTDYASVIEPDKLHFSMEISTGQRFWTGPVNKAELKLKGYNGRVEVSAHAHGIEKAKISHNNPKKYRDHNSRSFNANGQQIELHVTDGGKISFWLDGTPSLFSKSPEDWFLPEWQENEVRFSISDRVIAKTTELGAYAEFAPIPSALTTLLRESETELVHTYIFEDVMGKHAQRDTSNYKKLQASGIGKNYGLLSRTTRDSVPPSTESSLRFLRGYIENRYRLGIPIHVIAFVDEPNLRYKSYKDYEAYHVSLAEIVRELNKVRQTDIKIAAPESSRMVNGPTDSARKHQSGIEWTERLLRNNWDSLDIISWHMWQHRYLEALDQYPEVILDVAALNEKLAKEFARSPKRLAISQTNIGSGPNTSTYQQNTHYAGLWWASVVAQSLQTGKLDQLIWFKAVDEGVYGKGLLMQQEGLLQRKPIAQAMVFINQSILEQTLETVTSSHEVDMVATRALDGRHSVLCVNKSRRSYRLFLDTPHKFTKIEFLKSDGSQFTQMLSPAQQIGQASITLPHSSICRISVR